MENLAGRDTVMQAILLIVIGLMDSTSWWTIAFLFVLFMIWDDVLIPAGNHLLIEQTQGVAQR